jgi:hypothetical protein
MRLAIAGRRFEQDDELTYTRIVGYPRADDRLAGLAHAVDGGCCVGDAATVGRTLAQAPVWRARGALAFTVGLQDDAGHSLFTPTGQLDATALGHLKQVLVLADTLDMLPLLRCFSPAGNGSVPEALVGPALDGLVDWLLEAGFDRLIVDLRAGDLDEAYWPILRLDAISGLIDRLRDAVDVHNMSWRHQRQLYLAASLQLPLPEAGTSAGLGRLWHSVDLLWAHLPEPSTQSIAEALDPLVQLGVGARGLSKPVVCQGPGDAATLELCLERGVSWVAAAADAAFWAAVSQKVGQPAAPRSVTHLQHRIKSGHETVVRGRRNVVRY